MTPVLVRAYGLFWRRDETQWFPGRGIREEFRLLGRIGSNRGSIRIANMRDQVGLYVLHDDWGVYYVGLTLRQSLGKRRRDHAEDGHADAWDRFSWFGFRQVLKATDSNGISRLRELPRLTLGDPEDAVRDLEALLIRLHNPRGNVNKMTFGHAEEWTQIKLDEVDQFRVRVL